MIKVKVNNEYKDIIKIFCGGTLQKEIIKVWSGEAHEYVYESSVEYTGSLPITINTDGNALLDYRIYGASGGAGEPTESGEPVGYKLPMTVGKKLYNAKNDIQGYYIGNNGAIMKWDSDMNYVSDKIPVSPGKKYTLYYPLTVSGNSLSCAFYDDSDDPLRIISVQSTTPPYEKIYHLVAPNGATYFRTSIKRNPDSEPIALFVEHMDNTPTPVYIGENQLDAGEYVSYEEQKIYRDVGGTLTPTDPPVPLPEIPTIKGETVIDYDGTPKPSQMYIKYRR